MATPVFRGRGQYERARATGVGGTSAPQVIALADELEAFTARGVRRLIATLVNRLTEETPKFTGYASVNWMATVKVPFEGLNGNKPSIFSSDIDDFTYPADPAGGDSALRIQAAIVEVNKARVAQVAAAELAMASYTVKSGGPVFVVNNTDYIGQLDEGYSTKAEPGFIGATIRGTIVDVATGGARNLRATTKRKKAAGESYVPKGMGVAPSKYDNFEDDEFDI